MVIPKKAGKSGGGKIKPRQVDDGNRPSPGFFSKDNPKPRRDGGGFKYSLIFTPIPEKMIQFDEHTFEMGWLKPPPSREGLFFF